MEFNRAQLKQNVKLSMKGTSPRPMLVTLAFTAVVSAGTWLINTVLGWLLTGGGAGSFSELYLHFLQMGYEVEEAMEQAVLVFLSQGPGAIFGAVVGGGVLSIIVSLWSSAMEVGYEGYALSMVRHENPPLRKVFCALPQIGQVLITRVLTGLFIVLWSLLLGVGYLVVVVVAALIDVPALTVLLVLAAIVALVLGVVWITMRYALVDYVLLDQGLYGMDAIRESKRLMQGNIGKGFVLQLSFIGWYLLIFAILYGGIIAAVVPILSQISASSTGGLIAASGVSLVIILAAVVGMMAIVLWLRPYVTGCWAGFYEWTRGGAGGFAGGAGYGGGAGGWNQPTDYSWSSGTSSGTGTGSAPGNGGSAPKPPKPRDDPWN